MKPRLIWTTALLMGLLLIVMSSCGPAATSAPGTKAPAPETPTPTSPQVEIPSTQRQRINGTLSKIGGNILTLTTAQGPVTVKITDNTTVQKLTVGILSDLKEGASIIATGPQDANGNIAATSIVIRSQAQSTATAIPEGSTPANPRAPRTGARRGASGTLTKIAGKVLTVTTSQGPVTVNIGSDTTFQKSTTGTLSDLREGKTLTVSGPQDANGIVTASTIYIEP